MSDTYAIGFDSGGARGDKGLSDNEGTNELMGGTSGIDSSVASKTGVKELVVKGSVSNLTMDLRIFCTGVFSRTDRRIGLGFSGREKSGAFIPTKTMNNGAMTVNKRRQLL